jgi:hypothetical protein
MTWVLSPAPAAQCHGADDDADGVRHAGMAVEHGRHAYLADRYSFKMSLIAQ